MFMLRNNASLLLMIVIWNLEYLG